MSLSFPASPTVNQTYSFGSSTYKWDGGKWISVVTEPSRLVSGSNSLEINGNSLVWVGGDVSLSDKNIVIGDVASPTNITADGGGVTLKGAVDKTIAWLNATAAWTFSEHISIASAKEYRIAGIKVLDATGLGSAVVGSSLTSVGTIGTGTWQGTAIADTYLGTISTASKVSNSATTATSALGANTIVARDGSNNFVAGTITAALTGAASSNVLKAGDTMTGALVMPLGVFGTPSLTFTSDPNTGLFSPGADQVAISTGGTTKFTVGSLDGNPIIENNFPTVRPALDLAFAATKRLDPRVTFVRATSATYVGGDGLVKTAGVNEARFDHDPVTGESLGLLVEEARTNLISNSYSYLATYLTQFDTNNGIAPDGTNTASKATPNNGAVGGTTIVHQTTGITLNGTYTYSAFVKPLVSSWQFALYDNNNAQSSTITVTLDANGNASATGQNTNTTTQIYPNGWVRIIFTYIASSNATNYLQLYSFGYGTGDGNLKAHLVWGVQYEQGAFPTSYIPTSGSTVTRSADVASMTGTNFSSWYNQSEGSVFIDLIAVPGNRTQGNTNTFGISPVAGPWGGNLIGQNTDSQGTWYAYDAGFLGLIQTINLNPNGNKFAWGLTSGSNTSVVKDGTILSGGFLWGTLQRTALSIGTDSGGSIRWQRLTYYPKRLTNQQLQALTT